MAVVRRPGDSREQQVTKIRTKLGAIRKNHGIRVADLAAKVGVSRQTIHAIEAGNYLPNTEVTLKLARELRVAVEDLFSLPDERVEKPDVVTAEYLGQGTGQKGQAVRMGRVGGTWVSVPVDSRPYHLPEADAVVGSMGSGSPGARSRGSRIHLFSRQDAIGEKIVLAGCDPATNLLARMVETQSGVGVLHAPASSRLALDWLKAGKVHIAGSHLEDPGSAEFNLPFIRRRFRNRDMAVITFARWEEGFVVAPGNPREIRNVGDLGRRDVSLMNREQGSGSRGLLDGLIGKAGLAAASVRGYDDVAFGHLSAAHAVVTGQADCCVATRSAARAFDLDFVPLRSERYDFVLERNTLALPAVKVFFDVLQPSGSTRSS